MKVLKFGGTSIGTPDSLVKASSLAETVGILKSKINALCDRLTEICRGVYMLGVLPRRTHGPGAGILRTGPENGSLRP